MTPIKTASLTVPLRHSEKLSGLVATAAMSGDPAIYEEISITVERDGKPVADLLITSRPENGELRIYVSTDANAEEHTLAIHPERPQNQVVEYLYHT